MIVSRQNPTQHHYGITHRSHAPSPSMQRSAHDKVSTKSNVLCGVENIHLVDMYGIIAKGSRPSVFTSWYLRQS